MASFPKALKSALGNYSFDKLPPVHDPKTALGVSYEIVEKNRTNFVRSSLSQSLVVLLSRIRHMSNHLFTNIRKHATAKRRYQSISVFEMRLYEKLAEAKAWKDCFFVGKKINSL